MRSRSPVASYLARRRAYWPWWLLYHVSPYRQAIKQAIKNLRACGALEPLDPDIAMDTTLRR